jgi:hypothetical protein
VLVAVATCVDGKTPRLPVKRKLLDEKRPRLPGKRKFIDGKRPRLPGKSKFIDGKSRRLPGKKKLLAGKSWRHPGKKKFLGGKTIFLLIESEFIDGKTIALPIERNSCNNERFRPPARTKDQLRVTAASHRSMVSSISIDVLRPHAAGDLTVRSAPPRVGHRGEMEPLSRKMDLKTQTLHRSTARSLNS